MLERIRSYERQRRFWRLVDVAGRDECWHWRGPVDGAGQPRYGRRAAALHAYQLARGPLPARATLSRTCGTRLCVNPDHAERRPAG
jgi:hypothetical protein